MSQSTRITRRPACAYATAKFAAIADVLSRVPAPVTRRLRTCISALAKSMFTRIVRYASAARVPDPFSNDYPSFAAANNARLRAFLDQFGFDYEFLSSTECYTSGRFDRALLKVLERFDQVMAIMLPSLREERAQTYSPFLPISPVSGIVLQVPIIGHDARAGTITYEDPDSKERVTTPVTGVFSKFSSKPSPFSARCAPTTPVRLLGTPPDPGAPK